MPLEQLVAALERDAEAQAQALVAKARTEAAAISAQAEERLSRRRREVLGAREVERRAAAELALADARRLARREVLDARHRLLDRVFAAARAAIPAAVKSQAYRAALPAHVAEALACIGGDPAVVRCHPALVRDVRRIVAKKDHVSVRRDAGLGVGVKVVTADGVVEVDNTLEGRVARLGPVLALEVLQRLSPPA